MRFSADLTEYGWRHLEKGFLPALDRQGKTCQLLLGPEELLLIQTPNDTDGVHVTARLLVDRTFEATTYVCTSKHHNLIAFRVSIGLLLGVLKAARANKATSLTIKLSQKRTPMPLGAEVLTTILRCTARGDNICLVQEVPISKPYTAQAVDELVAAKDPTAMGPYYIDVQPCTGILQSMLDKMKSINDSMMLALSEHGDVHLHVTGLNVMLASHIRDLKVYPPREAVQAPDRSVPPEQQLQDALDAGTAIAVQLPIKHIARTLAAEAITQPSQLLFGIMDDQSLVHIMFVYRDSSSDQMYDDSLSLGFMLPVQVD